ncbi:hypothetical protein [Streptomyces paromomycinus]|uniref:Uncharacterized protein n=1 Tax=Streptomyces paromomycinus TaxID=92743 RepID=A0A401VXJ0_STREY|nr:hypothetical protein [Streptomyces paromomycinus]GCD41787.1 hypothetical protein GKJPGBOP_01444 [Streptomyces paromomycinus]
MNPRDALRPEPRTCQSTPEGTLSPWRFGPGAAPAADQQRRAARFTVDALGAALSGGQLITRPRLIHLAVVRGLCAGPPAMDITLPPAQGRLLTALAAGWTLREFAVACALSMAEAQDLRVLLRASLRSRTDEHAVARGHRVGALPRREDLSVPPLSAKAGRAA